MKLGADSLGPVNATNLDAWKSLILSGRGLHSRPMRAWSQICPRSNLCILHATAVDWTLKYILSKNMSIGWYAWISTLSPPWLRLFVMQTPREALIMMSAICERIEANPDKGRFLPDLALPEISQEYPMLQSLYLFRSSVDAYEGINDCEIEN